LAEKCTLTSAF